MVFYAQSTSAVISGPSLEQSHVGRVHVCLAVTSTFGGMTGIFTYYYGNMGVEQAPIPK